MPDIQNFSVTALSNANVNVPRWSIECRVVESRAGGAVLADFTGGNAITFPNVLGQLTAADRQEILEIIIHRLIMKRGGFS